MFSKQAAYSALSELNLKSREQIKMEKLLAWDTAYRTALSASHASGSPVKVMLSISSHRKDKIFFALGCCNKLPFFSVAWHS